MAHNQVVVIRHAGEEDPVPPVPSTPDEFKHAIVHTFTHESTFNNLPPSFWRTNSLRFPCRYDHHVFEGQVFSLPTELKQNQWTVRHVFCSPHCAKKFMVTQAEIQSRIFTLFALMMRIVYDWHGDVEPASDVELLLNPLAPMSIEAWRALPKQHVYVTLTVPELVPFRFETRNVVSHVLPTHPAHTDIKNYNRTVAEPGEHAEPAEDDEDDEEDGEGQLDPVEEDDDDFEIDDGKPQVVEEDAQPFEVPGKRKQRAD